MCSVVLALQDEKSDESTNRTNHCSNSVAVFWSQVGKESCWAKKFSLPICQQRGTTINVGFHSGGRLFAIVCSAFFLGDTEAGLIRV